MSNKPDFWEGYVPEPVKPATEESSATQAQQALDKKAENARELGLDYEPAQPVAWMTKTGSVWLCKASETDTPLYTSPPAQRTWVGLTDEELSEVYNQADWDTVNGWEYERAIEAKLKEKNNG